MVFEGVYGLRCRYRGGMCPESRAGWPRCAAARLSFPVRSGRRRTSNVAAVSARGILPYGGLVCCDRLPAVPEYRMMRPPSSCGNRAGCGAVAGRVSSDGRMGNWGRYAPRQPPAASGRTTPKRPRYTHPRHGVPAFQRGPLRRPCSHTKAVRSASRRNICLHGSSKRIGITGIKVANIFESAKNVAEAAPSSIWKKRPESLRPPCRP